MNKITKNLMKDFIEKFDLKSKGDSLDFEKTDILNMFNTIKDFFSDNPKSRMTKEVRLKCDIKKKLFENFTSMNKGKPTCNLYYFTLGTWENDNNLQTTTNAQKETISEIVSGLRNGSRQANIKQETQDVLAASAKNGEFQKYRAHRRLLYEKG